FERRDAFTGAVQSDHSQGTHSLADGHFAHLSRVRPGNNEFANFIRNGHRLDNGEAPRVTGILAAVAATPTIERHPIKNARINIEVLVHFGGISYGLLAVRTNAAHEPLGASENDGG